MKTVIAGAGVLDGRGAAAAPCDVYIDGSTIVDVRAHSDTHNGWTVLDATGLTVAPGFIDVHSHSDDAPLLRVDDTAKIFQGVTTEVTGNCGISIAPRRGSSVANGADEFFPAAPRERLRFRELMAATDSRGYVINYAPLVGHGTVRTAAMGAGARAPRAREQRLMAALLDEALEAGAFGMSTGLVYPPGAFAATDEVETLLRRLPTDAVYATHLRSESYGLRAAVVEALQAAETTGVRLQLSHHKAAGAANWGMTRETLLLVSAARARGLIVHQDVYPYTAGSTELAACLPPEYRDSGVQATLTLLADPQQRVNLEAMLCENPSRFENFFALAGAEGIRISTTASHEHEGLTLRELASKSGLSAFDALVDLLVAERLRVSMIVELMHEDDVQRVLLDPHTAIGSDSSNSGSGGKPHPRAFGTFPRVLGRYVRSQGLLSQGEAIRKMTGLPAKIFSLHDRGVVVAGKVADLVAFDAAVIADDHDYGHPRPPAGIAWVMLAGDLVVVAGKYLGRRRGIRLKPR